MKRKIFRVLQLVTGIHRIHHLYWSYGWKIPLFKVGFFPGKRSDRSHGFKLIKGHAIDYHNCTITGVY
jgi:hypothetical protein